MLSFPLRAFLVLAISCLLSAIPALVKAQAPVFELAVRVGEPIVASPVFNSSSAISQTVIDAAGNSYVTGGFQGVVRFGSTTLDAGGAYSDLFVAKLDPAGNYVWVVQAGGLSGNEEGNDIALDASGNVYITGGFTGPRTDFGATTLFSATGTGPEMDIVVAKLSANGQWLWAVSAGGTGGEQGRSLAVDAAGNAYVTGNFNSPQLPIGSTTLVNTAQTFPTSQDADIFTAKLDATGKWLWAVRAGGAGYDDGIGVAVDANSNAYITGYVQSARSDFGAFTLTQAGGAAAFVAKLSPSGNYLWAVAGGGNGSLADGSYAITLDGRGSVYVTGQFQNNGARFGTTALANTGFNDLYVAQLDAANGNWRWVVRAGGAGREMGTDLLADGQGNLYLTGYYEGTNLQLGATSLPYSGLIHDFFVAKLEAATGDWAWAVPAGGLENDVSRSLAIDAQSRVYVAGYYQSPSLRLGPLTLPGNVNFGNGSGFLARLAPEPKVQITGDSLLCAASTQLTASAPFPISSYRWSTGATTPTITVTQPGTYSVTVTSADGRISTAQFTVRSFTPTVRLIGDSLLCPGATAKLTALTSGPAPTYLWTTGATTATIDVTQPGTYGVTVRYGTSPCSASAELAVRVPTLRLSGNAQLCESGSSNTLLAIAPGATGFRWNTGATTPTLSVTQPGTYTVVATFTNGCTLSAAQLIIQPTLTLEGETILCPGKSTTLTAAYPVPATYEWSTGATTATIDVTQPGAYSVNVRSTVAPFCARTATIQVQAGSLLPTISLGADTTLCEYQQFTLRAPSLPAPVAYRWSDGSTGATLLVTQPGQYSLQLTGSCDTRTLSRNVRFQNCLFIPNIITPNSDRINDVFTVRGLAPGAWQFSVYNRWGKQVFTTSAYANDWGSSAAPGPYYYLLQQAGVIHKGWVEVVR